MLQNLTGWHALVILAIILLGHWGKKRQEATGRVFPLGRAAIGLLIGFPVIGWLVSGASLTLDMPELKGFNFSGGLTLSPEFAALMAGLVIYTSAFIAEVVRAGIASVPHGQVEAAYALGLTRTHTFFYVRMPQMWRLALPNFGNHMLSIMKDTALISVIGLEEIVFVGEMATAVTHQPFLMYMTVAVIYLAITTAITLLVWALERYANRHLEGAR